MFFLQSVTSGSQYATYIDKITDALINTSDGFAHFFEITRGLFAVFYLLLICFLYFQARSTNSPVSYYQMFKPIVFIILFELCFAPSVGIADNLSEEVGKYMGGDKVVGLLFKKSKIDINDYYDQQIAKVQNDDFWIRKTGLRKPVYIAIKQAMDKSDWAAISNAERAKVIEKVLVEEQLLKSESDMSWRDYLISTSTSRHEKVWGVLGENTESSRWTGGSFSSLIEDPELLDQFIKNVEANALHYTSMGQLFLMEGNTNSAVVNKVVIPIMNLINQVGYRVMYEVRVLYLTVLKFLAFFAFGFSIFYSTSDSWKKWLHQYICVLLWIVPLKIAELMMLFMKLDLASLLEGDQEMNWQGAIIMGIAQIVLITLTPTMVSNVIGSATLQGTTNNITGRASAAGVAMGAKLAQRMRNLK